MCDPMSPWNRRQLKDRNDDLRELEQHRSDVRFAIALGIMRVLLIVAAIAAEVGIFAWAFDKF